MVYTHLTFPDLCTLIFPMGPSGRSLREVNAGGPYINMRRGTLPSKVHEVTLTLPPSSFFPAAEVAAGCGSVVVSIASSVLLSPTGTQSGS